MTESEDIREVEPQETDSSGKSVHPKTRRAFSKLATELSQEELESPGVQIPIAEISRLEQDNFRLSSFQDQYHEAIKNVKF